MAVPACVFQSDRITVDIFKFG